MPDKVCSYCGRTERPELRLYIDECPVCTALACSLCMAHIKIFKVLSKDDEPTIVHIDEGEVCKVHVPWNIIAGLERRAKENGR